MHNISIRMFSQPKHKIFLLSHFKFDGIDYMHLFNKQMSIISERMRHRNEIESFQFGQLSDQHQLKSIHKVTAKIYSEKN